jgi:hypothetical protein
MFDQLGQCWICSLSLSLSFSSSSYLCVCSWMMEKRKVEHCKWGECTVKTFVTWNRPQSRKKAPFCILQIKNMCAQSNVFSQSFLPHVAAKLHCVSQKHNNSNMQAAARRLDGRTDGPPIIEKSRPAPHIWIHSLCDYNGRWAATTK